jgi:hypothetical protein
VRWCGVPAHPVRLAEAAPCAIALHRILELPAHGKPCPRRLGSLAPQHDERRPVDASASLEERLKIGAAGQPLGSREATR